MNKNIFLIKLSILIYICIWIIIKEAQLAHNDIITMLQNSKAALKELIKKRKDELKDPTKLIDESL
jgi:hypothetical protein